MNYYLNFSLLIFTYLLCSINSAIIVSYIFKLPSPRNVGSGNPGTTNILRIGGKLPAIFTLSFDVFKSLLPVFFTKILIPNEFILACVALCAILGHIFPIFFNFKGGKGIATFIGVLFGLYWFFGIIFISVWLITAFITRYSSLSALVATIIVTIYIIFTNNIQVNILFLIIAIIIFLKHKKNIQQLIYGKERKIGHKN